MTRTPFAGPSRAAARPFHAWRKGVSRKRHHSTAPRHGRAEVYSLWLRPAGSARRRLALFIGRLARRCRTTPFEPHLTLLGGIALPPRRAIENTAVLARAMPPVPVRLGGPGHQAAFFRCLYLRASGAALREARAQALHAMAEGVGPRGSRLGRGPFRPHVSLIYGRLPVAQRRMIVRELRGKLALTFIAREMALVRTGGDPDAWRVLAVRRLAGRAPAGHGFASLSRRSARFASLRPPR